MMQARLVAGRPNAAMAVEAIIVDRAIFSVFDYVTVTPNSRGERPTTKGMKKPLLEKGTVNGDVFTSGSS